MPNGNHALKLLAPEPAVGPKDASAGAMAGESIGRAMAAAVTGLGFALAEFENGGLRPETRLANGTRIAALYELQQAHAGEISFEAVAREQGRIALRQFLDAGGFYQCYSAEQGDALLDMLIADVLAVVSRVDAVMRAGAH
jgi:hypothetical protein